MVDASSADPRMAKTGAIAAPSRFVATVSDIASETLPIATSGLSDWHQNELVVPWPTAAHVMPEGASADLLLSQIGVDLAMGRLSANMLDPTFPANIAAQRIGHHILSGNLDGLDAEIRLTVLNTSLKLQESKESLAEINQALNEIGLNLWPDWSVNEKKLRQVVLTGFNPQGVGLSVDRAPQLYGVVSSSQKMELYPAPFHEVAAALEAIRINAVDWLLGRNREVWQFFADQYQQSHGGWVQGLDSERPQDLHTFPSETTSMVAAVISQNLKHGRKLGLGFEALKDIAEKFTDELNSAFQTAERLQHLRAQVKWERTFMLDGSLVRNARLVWFETRCDGLQGCDQYLGLQTVFELKEAKLWKR